MWEVWCQHNQTKKKNCNKAKQNTSQNIKEHPNHALNTNRYLQNKNKEQEAKINAKHIVEGYGKYEGHHSCLQSPFTVSIDSRRRIVLSQCSVIYNLTID